jgi:hypothetical protein
MAQKPLAAGDNAMISDMNRCAQDNPRMRDHRHTLKR